MAARGLALLGGERQRRGQRGGGAAQFLGGQLLVEAAPALAQIQASPIRYLTGRAAVGTRKGQELIVLTLIRLATQDPDQAATQLESKWSVQLAPEERHWLWAVIGKQAALKLQDGATAHFAKVARDQDLNDDLLAWKTRAALRQ